MGGGGLQPIKPKTTIQLISNLGLVFFGFFFFFWLFRFFLFFSILADLTGLTSSGLGVLNDNNSCYKTFAGLYRH